MIIIRLLLSFAFLGWWSLIKGKEEIEILAHAYHLLNRTYEVFSYVYSAFKGKLSAEGSKSKLRRFIGGL